MAKAYPKAFAGAPRRPRIVPESAVPISLDPPTQARLYSEVEVMICVTANTFLVRQYEAGRISEESIKRVTNFWGSKNRPQVVEFQFDQATQRRLILSNIRTLSFDGESSTNPILLHSNLHNWKAVVKEMSVRTFCAPDSAIRKHMHDIHKLLEMLGAHDATLLAFEEQWSYGLDNINSSSPWSSQIYLCFSLLSRHPCCYVTRLCLAWSCFSLIPSYSEALRKLIQSDRKILSNLSLNSYPNR